MKITLTADKKIKPDFSKLGFGKYFTDHMLVVDYKNGEWGEPEIMPFGNLSLSPASVVFHYGQEIFEGCKAYKSESGKVTMFRAADNVKRMNNSARRLCMAELPVKETVEAVERLVLTDIDWIPTASGTSLYVRPTLIGTEAFLGVHPSAEFKFFVILSPVGSYYANGLAPIKINVEDKYLRAGKGGTGESKCGGNYAASLFAAENAKKQGFDQVLYL
ncbi:MAG: aminotransferase class IV, partial [Clostridiales bacterium]|nr:aminotransferase class IV [Clostridiales bacterium]